MTGWDALGWVLAFSCGSVGLLTTFVGAAIVVGVLSGGSERTK